MRRRRHLLETLIGEQLIVIAGPEGRNAQTARPMFFWFRACKNYAYLLLFYCDRT
jgi:hypothetical protein